MQELAQGKSLAELVEGGWRADEAEARRIAIEMLGILAYLASRRPPVTHRCPLAVCIVQHQMLFTSPSLDFHLLQSLAALSGWHPWLTACHRNARDIKPENIVLEGGQTGGRVFLVDFGGVQAAAASEALGMASTVIGTYGHMAPEQFRGAAQPASDLYGLGGTLLYLLSGRGHCLSAQVTALKLQPALTAPAWFIRIPYLKHFISKAAHRALQKLGLNLRRLGGAE